jgi:hypothetical protein
MEQLYYDNQKQAKKAMEKKAERLISSIPSIDQIPYEKLELTIKQLNKNPIESYKQLHLLSEKQNKLTQTENGRALLSYLKSNINIDENGVEKALMSDKEIISTDQMDELVKGNHLKDAYKKLYNAYTYEVQDPKTAMQLRNALAQVKFKAYEMGENPADYLENDKFYKKAVKGLFRILNVPVNLIMQPIAAMIHKKKYGMDGLSQSEYRKKTAKKIWTGMGAEDVIREIGMNPKILKIIEKKKNSIPLTPAEEKEIRKFNIITGGLGFVIDIIADPLDIIGKVAKTVKGLKTLAKGMDVAEIADQVKDNLKLIEPAIQSLTKRPGKVPKAVEKAIETLDNAFRKKIMTEAEAVKYIEETANVLKKYDKLEEATGILDTIAPMRKAISEADDARKTLKQPVYEKLSKIGDKLQNAKESVLEWTGLRKLLISDVKLGAQTEALQRAYKSLEDATTTFAEMQSKAIDKFDDIKSQLDSVLRVNKSKLERKGLSWMSASDLLAEARENPKWVKSLVGGNEILPKLEDYYDDILFLEIEKAGLGTILGIKSDILQGKLKGYMKKYRKTLADNKHHPDLKKMRKNIKNVLRKNLDEIDWRDLNMGEVVGTGKKRYIELFKPEKLADGGEIERLDVDDIFDELLYNPHVMDDGFKAWTESLGRKGRNRFNIKNKVTDLLKGTGNKAQKQRKMTKSNMIEMIEARKVKAKDPNAYKEILDYLKSPDFKGSIKDINKIGMDETLFRQYFDIPEDIAVPVGKIFTSDVDKVLTSRGVDMLKSIQKNQITEAMVPFMSDTLEKGMVPVNGIQGFDPKVTFAPKDVYETLKRAYGMIDRPAPAIRLFKAVQRIWKAVTLGLSPTTVVRNNIGNLFNSFLALDKPSDVNRLIKMYNKAHFLVTKSGKKMPSFTTKTGRIITHDEIAKQVQKYGLDQAMYKYEVGLKDELGLGKALSGIEEASRKGAERINKAILQRVNNYSEKTAKVALFLEGVEKGLSYEDAAKRAFKYLFDYGDVPTRFKNSIAHFFPFSRWLRFNIPLQVSNAMSFPSRALFRAQMAGSKNRIGDREIDNRFQSEWLEDTPKIKMPTRGDQENPKFLLLEGIIPFYDINMVLRPIFKEKKFESLLDELVGAMTPLIKTPLELLTNRDFTFKKDLKRSEMQDKEYLGFRMPVGMQKLLMNIRPLAQLEKMGLGDWIAKKRGIVYTKPKQDTVRGILSYILFAPVEYDVPFSKTIQTYSTRKDIINEISSYRSLMEKYKRSLYQGNKVTKKQSDFLLSRARAITKVLMQAHIDGKIDEKTRDQLMSQIVNIWMY